MATQTVHTDDMTGEVESEENPVLTWFFAFDGEWREIDLTEVSFEKFRKAIKPYVAASRSTSETRAKANGGLTNRTGTRTGTDRDHALEVREWGKANGYKVNERGRLSDDLVEAFNKAHASAA
jgi:hypothetical protein